MVEEVGTVGGSGAGAVAPTDPFFGVEDVGEAKGFTTGLFVLGSDSKRTIFCFDCLTDDWPSPVGIGLLWFGLNTCAAVSGGSGGGSFSTATKATSVGRDKGGSDTIENDRNKGSIRLDKNEL